MFFKFISDRNTNFIEPLFGWMLRHVCVYFPSAFIVSFGFFGLAPNKTNLAAPFNVSLDVPLAKSSNEVRFGLGLGRYEKEDGEYRNE